MFNSISFINLYSKENKKLIAFYRDVLGIEALPNQNEDDHWYGFKTEGTTLAIEPHSNRQGYPFNFNKDNPILIQFKAASENELEQMNQQLEANGVTLLRRSEVRSYGLVTNFVDPDGNILEILYDNTHK